MLVSLAALFLTVSALLAAMTGQSLGTARLVPGLVVAAAAVLAARGPRTATVVLLAAAVAVASLLDDGPAQATGPPVYALGALAYAVALLYRTRTVAVLVAVGGLGYIALRTTRHGDDVVLRALDDVTVLGSIAVVGSMLFTILNRISLASDATERARLEAEVGTAIELAERQRQRAVHHLLHDDVIAALRMVADFPRHTLERVRTTCRRTAEAIRATGADAQPPEGDISALLAAAVSQTRLRPQVMATPAGAQAEPVRLDDDQRAALARAVSEALRNIERHTDVETVTLGSWTTPTHHVIRVVDAGPGLRDASPGWGRRHAIELSLRDIGGEASVTSPEEGGTAVELRWPVAPPPPRSRLEETHGETLSALGDGRIVVVIAVTVLLPHVYMGLRYVGADALSPYEAAYGLALAATILATALHLRDRPLGPLPLLGISWGIAAGAGGLSWADPSSLLSFESWFLGPSALALTIVAFFLPMRWLVVVVAPLPVALLAVVYVDPSLSATAASGSVNVTILPPVFGYVLGAVLRESGRELAEQTRQLAATTQRVQRERLLAESRQAPAGFVRGRVARWLDAVAAGRLDPGEADVRTEAHLLSLEVRDELTLPGVLDETLRLRISRVRRRGIDVELTRPEGQPVNPAATLRLLDRLLDLGDEPSSVVVRLPTVDHPGEVALLPVLGEERLRAVLPGDGDPHRVRHDEFSTVVTEPDPARSASGSPAITGGATAPATRRRDHDEIAR